MDISSIASGTASAADSARNKLSGNFDSFLKLLTSQLANQDPLNPLDSNQFVSQLVNFSSVEQAINTNDNLESLIALSTVGQAAAAVNYLGNTVTAAGDTATLANGQATFAYSLPENANATTIRITNDAGVTVFTGSGAIASGGHDFVWDGRADNGVVQPDGVYTIAIAATAADGTPISATTSISGKVNGIETVDGKLVLDLGGVSVPFESVTSVVASTP